MSEITSIEVLKEYAKGEIVELPPFSVTQPFVARLKRPSMLQMVKRGEIPNELLTKANDLFMTGGKRIPTSDVTMLDGIFDIVDAIARETFVEPKYDDIKAAGIELTDDQLMFVFNYTQEGVKALESFRTKPTN